LFEISGFLYLVLVGRGAFLGFLLLSSLSSSSKAANMSAMVFLLALSVFAESENVHTDAEEIDVEIRSRLQHRYILYQRWLCVLN